MSVYKLQLKPVPISANPIEKSSVAAVEVQLVVKWIQQSPCSRPEKCCRQIFSNILM